MVQCWVGRVGVRIDKGSIARVGLSLSPTSVYLRESVGRGGGGRLARSTYARRTLLVEGDGLGLWALVRGCGLFGWGV
jgi:hypothetical protein